MKRRTIYKSIFGAVLVIGVSAGFYVSQTNTSADTTAKSSSEEVQVEGKSVECITFENKDGSTREILVTVKPYEKSSELKGYDYEEKHADGTTTGEQAGTDSNQ